MDAKTPKNRKSSSDGVTGNVKDLRNTIEWLQDQGDLIETTARVVHTSTHTAGVHVVAKRLDRSEWVTEEICSGFFFMVAIDSEMKPIPIPQFTPNGEEEQRMWDLAQAARDAMKSAGQ